MSLELNRKFKLNSCKNLMTARILKVPSHFSGFLFSVFTNPLRLSVFAIANANTGNQKQTKFIDAP